MIYNFKPMRKMTLKPLVSLANMDGEKVEFNATGQGSVEAIFNAIDKFLTNLSAWCPIPLML